MTKKTFLWLLSSLSSVNPAFGQNYWTGSNYATTSSTSAGSYGSMLGTAAVTVSTCNTTTGTLSGTLTSSSNCTSSIYSLSNSDTTASTPNCTTTPSGTSTPTPGTPGTPGAPGTPTSSLPGTPGTPSPGTPGLPGTPGTPEPGTTSTPTPVIPGTPGTPGISTPSLPGTPGIPTSSLPGTPGTPTPGTPGLPGTPGTATPSLPGTPGTPTPGTPGTPTPIIPGTPGTPTPSLPGTPGTPTPGTPGIPGTPTPGTPGLPGTPGTPTPSLPGTPGTPTPGLPGTPGTPGTPTPSLPGIPGTPTPNLPGTPGTPSPSLPGTPGTPTPGTAGTPTPLAPGSTSTLSLLPPGSTTTLNLQPPGSTTTLSLLPPGSTSTSGTAGGGGGTGPSGSNTPTGGNGPTGTNGGGGGTGPSGSNTPTGGNGPTGTNGGGGGTGPSGSNTPTGGNGPTGSGTPAETPTSTESNSNSGTQESTTGTSTTTSSSTSSGSAGPALYHIYPKELIDQPTKDQVQQELIDAVGDKSKVETYGFSKTVLWIAPLNSTQVEHFKAHPSIGHVFPNTRVVFNWDRAANINVSVKERQKRPSRTVNKRAIVTQEDPAPTELRVVSQHTGSPLLDKFTYDDTAGRGVWVYMIDSGVDPNSEEWQGMTGQKDWMFPIPEIVSGQNDPSPIQHGTKVQALITGPTFGTAKAANLMVVKIVKEGLHANHLIRIIQSVGNDIIAKGLQKKAVINMSWDFELPDDATDAQYDQIENLFTNLEVLDAPLTTAAGNNAPHVPDIDGFPAIYAEGLGHIIVVGSSDANGDRSAFSQIPEDVDQTLVYAPGENVHWKSVIQNGRRVTTDDVDSGTSFACAKVAGVAAYFLGLPAQRTWQDTTWGREIKHLLYNTAWERHPGSNIRIVYNGVFGFPGANPGQCQKRDGNCTNSQTSQPTTLSTATTATTPAVSTAIDIYEVQVPAGGKLPSDMAWWAAVPAPTGTGVLGTATNTIDCAQNPLSDHTMTKGDGEKIPGYPTAFAFSSLNGLDACTVHSSDQKMTCTIKDKSTTVINCPTNTGNPGKCDSEHYQRMAHCEY